MGKRQTYDIVVYDSIQDYRNYNGYVKAYGLSKASACVGAVEILQDRQAAVVKIQSDDREDITIIQGMI